MLEPPESNDHNNFADHIFTGQEAWCWHAEGFPHAWWLGFPYWLSHVCIWWSCLYPLRAHLQAPFRAGARALTPAMELHNKNMSKVRTSVERIFGDVINSFKSLDFKNNLKIGLSTIGKMYVVCAIIRNALTCMYGNQTSAFFAVEPPSVHEYFS